MIKIKTICIIILSYLYAVHILHSIYDYTLAQHWPYEKVFVFKHELLWKSFAHGLKHLIYSQPEALPTGQSQFILCN